MTTVDITQLPTFASGTQPDYAAYEGLAVRAMAKGSTYTDPKSGLTVRKLTDATFAATELSIANNLAVSTQYPSGPPAISLPWGTNMRTMYVVVRDPSSNGIPTLFDFNESTGAVSNIRRAPNVARDLTFGFSNNPATPQIAYYIKSVGGDYRYIQRYDTATNTDANIGHFPANLTGLATASYVHWLQWDQSDSVFCCMSGSVGVDVGVWDAATGTASVHAFDNLDEPHITPDGAYVMVDRGSSGSDRIRVSDRTVLTPNSCGQVSHPVGIRPSRMALHQGSDMEYYDLAADTTTTTQPSTQVVNTDLHKFAQWVQSNADPLDDWIGVCAEGPPSSAVTSSSWAAATAPKYSVSIAAGGLSGTIDTVVQSNGAGSITQQLTKVASAAAIVAAGQYSYVGGVLTVRAFGDLDLTVAGNASRIYFFSSAALGSTGIGYYPANGSGLARLVAHAYSTGGYSVTYDRSVFASASPDGKYVMFQSDMNLATGRHDTFLVALPTMAGAAFTDPTKCVVTCN